MRDKFDREINYLRVSITDRCNLHCAYCRPKEGISLKGHDDILRYEQIIRIVSQAVKMGFIKVRLTGGEPLVRRGFVDFITDLKKIDGLQEISLTTNGILLEQFAQNIFDAGIHRINISLDSLNKEKYFKITNGGNLDAVLCGIDTAKKIGFSPIKINAVLFSDLNHGEILDFARLAADKSFQVRFIELMPIGQVNKNRTEEHLRPSHIIKTISRYYDLEAVKAKKNASDGPARIYKIKGSFGEIGVINPVSDHFCNTCNRLRLTADGKLRACLLKDDEIDVKKALEENCSDEELKNILRQAILLKPQHHDLDCVDRHFKKCQRDMSDIGG